MKTFVYKLILITLAFIVTYKLTIGDEINSIISKTELLTTKEGRKETINKIRYEINRAIKKENYLSREDAVLINKFLNKIKSELKKAESQ